MSLFSADSDFGVILASQAASHPSFILFREPNLLRTQDYMDLLVAALPTLEPELASGCVAGLYQVNCRVATIITDRPPAQIRTCALTHTLLLRMSGVDALTGMRMQTTCWTTVRTASFFSSSK